MRGSCGFWFAVPVRIVGRPPNKGLAGSSGEGTDHDNPVRRLRSGSAFLLALCHCVLVCWVGAAAPFCCADDFRTPSIAAAELMALQGRSDAPLVVDVRPNGEYKSGHVAGAINIPYDKMEKHLDQLTEARRGVVLYCTQGHRTRQAEQTLVEHDLANVFHLEGGLPAWRQAGYPIHTGWGP